MERTFASLPAHTRLLAHCIALTFYFNKRGARPMDIDVDAHQIAVFHACSFLVPTLFELFTKAEKEAPKKATKQPPAKKRRTKSKTAAKNAVSTINTYFASARWQPFMEAALLKEGEGLTINFADDFMGEFLNKLIKKFMETRGGHFDLRGLSRATQYRVGRYVARIRRGLQEQKRAKNIKAMQEKDTKAARIKQNRTWNKQAKEETASSGHFEGLTTETDGVVLGACIPGFDSTHRGNGDQPRNKNDFFGPNSSTSDAAAAAPSEGLQMQFGDAEAYDADDPTIMQLDIELECDAGVAQGRSTEAPEPMPALQTSQLEGSESVGEHAHARDTVKPSGLQSTRAGQFRKNLQAAQKSNTYKRDDGTTVHYQTQCGHAHLFGTAALMGMVAEELRDAMSQEGLPCTKPTNLQPNYYKMRIGSAIMHIGVGEGSVRAGNHHAHAHWRMARYELGAREQVDYRYVFDVEPTAWSAYIAFGLRTEALVSDMLCNGKKPFLACICGFSPHKHCFTAIRNDHELPEGLPIDHPLPAGFSAFDNVRQYAALRMPHTLSTVQGAVEWVYWRTRSVPTIQAVRDTIMSHWGSGGQTWCEAFTTRAHEQIVLSVIRERVTTPPLAVDSLPPFFRGQQVVCRFTRATQREGQPLNYRRVQGFTKWYHGIVVSRNNTPKDTHRVLFDPDEGHARDLASDLHMQTPLRLGLDQDGKRSIYDHATLVGMSAADRALVLSGLNDDEIAKLLA